MKPTRGTIFQHNHFLNPNTQQPLACKVTTVRAGRVYFQPYYGTHEDGSDWLGSPYFLTTDRWQKEYGN